MASLASRAGYSARSRACFRCNDSGQRLLHGGSGGRLEATRLAWGSFVLSALVWRGCCRERMWALMAGKSGVFPGHVMEGLVLKILIR